MTFFAVTKGIPFVILFTTEAPLGNAALADMEKFSAGQRLITFHQRKIAAHDFHRRDWELELPTGRDICVCYNQQSSYNENHVLLSSL